MKRCAPLLLFLGACAGAPGPDRGPRIADLSSEVLPEETATSHVTAQDVARRYRELLAEDLSAGDEYLVRRRMADLSLRDAERELAAGGVPRAALQRAVDAYTELLASSVASDPDVLLYQLARALELQGETERAAQLLARLGTDHPDSVHAEEAWFRVGEQRFAAGSYAQAARAYARVSSRQSASRLADDALYMLGWSQFKLAEYDSAAASFARLLNRRHPSDAALDALPSGERRLLRDTLRALALTVSEQGGVEYIAGLDKVRSDWEPALYQGLGEFYLGKKRYQDAAQTWQAFIELNRRHRQAPVFHQRLIETWQKAGFPSLVLPEKTRFVLAYGIESDYWAGRDESELDALRAMLRPYLEEISRESHAAAQQQEEPDLARELYRETAGWYRQMIATFPAEPGMQEVRFLLGEVQFESGDYIASIDAYEAVAYDGTGHPRGADAGYAALLAYDALMQSGEDPDTVQEMAVASQLRFAETYADDPRSNAVLASAADSLFAAASYQDAISVAERLLQRDDASAEHRRTALLVKGHAAFALEDYALAEHTYALLLQADLLHAEQHAAMYERLASAIHRQGEAALEADEHDAAVAHFLRVAQVTPESALRHNADFDASTGLLQLQRYDQAIELLLRFRQRYPESEYRTEVDRRLVLCYEQGGHWRAAAAELENLALTEADEDRTREARYLAAQYYQRAAAGPQAIRAWQQYVQHHPQPFDLHIEALAALIELEQGSARTHWQQTLVDTEAAAPESNDRARYLAAGIVLERALRSRKSLDALPIEQPLARTLRAKRAQLQEVIGLYEKVASYGIQDLTTRSTYETAEIYRALATELIAVPAPGGLNALEREQYQLLLEEQAMPFEDLAIELYEKNGERARQQVWDDWVASSFARLEEMVPGRYAREEEVIAHATSLH